MHYECSLVQATIAGSRKNANTGDSEDLYAPPNNTQFDSTSPNAKWWDGGNSGLNITGVSASGATTFNARFDHVAEQHFVLSTFTSPPPERGRTSKTSGGARCRPDARRRHKHVRTAGRAQAYNGSDRVRGCR